MSFSARTEMRPNDSRENLREEPARLTRRRSITEDKFHIPDHLKKDGMSYEWKRKTNAGQVDMEHQVLLAENHWKPVQADQMPGMMMADYSGVVERGGQILMARPSYLTDEATQEVLDISRQRVRTNEQRLGLTAQGELPRTRPNISREYSPVTAADKSAVRQIPD
ncbi:MAG TPA: hypothetical protein PKX13_12015 [Acidiphilium sp.]|nr:hypothetical protein [Acidiphilium sp.]